METHPSVVDAVASNETLAIKGWWYTITSGLEKVYHHAAQVLQGDISGSHGSECEDDCLLGRFSV
jgi:hypothetical protein